MKKMEMVCDVCNYVSEKNEKFELWMRTSTGLQSQNKKLGIHDIDICPICSIKIAKYINSI